MMLRQAQDEQGFTLTPTLSHQGRGGLLFYIDGQDWGGTGIANPRIEYGVAMTGCGGR